MESIAASLPICDEFLISDGYSTDGTFEVLERISKVNKKIKLSRQEWPKTRKYSVIGEVTNALRAKCTYEYIFSIQANEVVHEKNVDFIRSLPEICPQVNTFSFPFTHIVRDKRFYEDFRLRFSKNLSNVVAVVDAWTLGLNNEYIKSETYRSLTHPKRLRQYINKGIEWTFANQCESQLSRAIYLPEPIYRYWSLFPSDYLEKCRKHVEMFGLDELKADMELLEKYVADPSAFWDKAAEIRRKELNFHYPFALGSVAFVDHPKVMQGLIADASRTSYSVREEVIDSIRDL